MANDGRDGSLTPTARPPTARASTAKAGDTLAGRQAVRGLGPEREALRTLRGRARGASPRGRRESSADDSDGAIHGINN